MKTNLKRYKLIAFLEVLAILLLTSCSLDFPVEDEITGLDAIDNVAIANETLSGIYIAYPKNKISFSKLADDFYPNHTIYDNVTDYEFYKWNSYEIQLLANSLWNSYYSTISKENILLDRVEKIQTETNEEQQELNEIKAETLCLKALCFFDLIQIYCESYSKTTKNNLGIILKNKVKSEELKRSSLEDSYKATEKLLLEAIPIFPETEKTSYRFSKISAKTLLAKLYFNWKKYDKAIDLCNEIITQKAVTSTSFGAIWEDLQKSNKNIIVSETILAMEETLSYFSEIYDEQQNEDEYYLNSNIVFENTDTRKQTAIITDMFIKLDNSTIEVNYLGKLRTNIQDTEAKSIPIFRVAELYFIKAESEYHLAKEVEAKQTINSFLELRNTSLISSSGEDFLKELLKEKQKEFIGEGLRYFDLKRNHFSLDRVNSTNNVFLFSILPTDYRWVFPIGETEMKYNKNIENNKGW